MDFQGTQKNGLLSGENFHCPECNVSAFITEKMIKKAKEFMPVLRGKTNVEVAQALILAKEITEFVNDKLDGSTGT